jgi:hypothetical protein
MSECVKAYLLQVRILQLGREAFACLEEARADCFLLRLLHLLISEFEN